MTKNLDFTEEEIKYITEYVYKNYRYYKGKSLIIKELGSCIGILKNPDGSPLILSKKLLDNIQ